MKTHIDIRYSKDGGHNWSDWRQIPMGEVGDFRKQITSRGFGIGRDWVFDVRVTDPVRCDIMDASFMPEGTES